MLTAITRRVSPALANCELSFLARTPIDVERARAQHRAYELLLERLGARVLSLPAEPGLPDSVFVEDAAIVLDEIAVVFPFGAEARRPEAASIAAALAPFRKVEWVQLPATIEGGDVLRVGRQLFVGLTRRTNAEGIRELTRIAAPHRYEVIPVAVSGCLHLKSAVTHLGGQTMLINRAWCDSAALGAFDFVDVDPAEPHAANALAVAGTVVFPSSFPKTREVIERCGFDVTPLDISELQKAESGLTCSSLLFEAP